MWCGVGTCTRVGCADGKERKWKGRWHVGDGEAEGEGEGALYDIEGEGALYDIEVVYFVPTDRTTSNFLTPNFLGEPFSPVPVPIPVLDPGYPSSRRLC